MEQFSFRRGWSQLKLQDAALCRSQIMSALEIKTRAAFLARLRGSVEPKVSEARKIEGIFKEFGIVNVWGED